MEDHADALVRGLRRLNLVATRSDLLTSGLPVRTILGDVLKEIDGSLEKDSVDDMVALLTILGLEPNRGALERGERLTVLPLLEFCLSRLVTHKKTVYDARFGLSLRVLAEHARPRPAVADAAKEEWTRLRGAWGPAAAAEARVGDDVDDDPPGAATPLFERVIEVGIPDSWDVEKLVALARIDGAETAAHPRRTMAQRWKASARRLATKMLGRRGSKGPAAKRAASGVSPPADCLHATEPGAVTPQLLWSYPRRDPGGLAGEVVPFCFPNGIPVVEAAPAGGLEDGEDDYFVFQLSLADGASGGAGGAAAPAAGQSQSLVYGVCVIEWASQPLGDGGRAARLPRATCLVTRIPLLAFQAAVLRDAIGVARKAKDVDGRRLALRSVFGRFAGVAAPAPGGEARFAAKAGAVERVGRRAAAGGALNFFGPSNSGEARPSSLPPPSPRMAWTAGEYAAVAATVDWALPRLLRQLPVHTLLRALAGVLCEMQVVVISSHPAAGAAAVLGLAALARPLLWVGPLVPVLPAALHSLLEAPLPFVVGAPKTETWARCIGERLPRPGFFVLDADDRALCFHPHDADLLELPHADALAEALAPLLDGARRAASPDDPRAVKAATHAARLISRHVAKLVTVALKFETKQASNPARRSALAQSVRGRESIEFANLMKREFDGSDEEEEAETEADARARTSPGRASCGSVECSRSLVRSGFLATTDPRSSALWARRSTNLRLDESIAKDPMRRVFFERLAESQAYAVYRESFPTFAGFGVDSKRPQPRSFAKKPEPPAPEPPRPDVDESPTSVDDDPLLATLAWRPPTPDLDRPDTTPLHRPRASISPLRSKSPAHHTFSVATADDEASAFHLDDPGSIVTDLGLADSP